MDDLRAGGWTVIENGGDEPESEPADPLGALAELEDNPPSCDLDSALRDVRESLQASDPIARTIARKDAIAILREKGVPSPASLVDATLRGLGREEDSGAGTGLDALTKDVEPSEEPVDGAELLEDLVELFRRFLVLQEGSAEALALWVVFTYGIDAFDISPRLAITSPTKRCGKTRCLELLRALVRRPLPASNITAAAVFRSIERFGPTLLVDEADTFLRDNDELRGVLNSGQCRTSAFVVRCDGEDKEPRQFSTWAPVAIALIGDLPGTLADRSVAIAMRRKATGENVERFRFKAIETITAPIRARIARWVEDEKASLRAADPGDPEGLDDRAADNWRPLLAIAEVAGASRWLDRARKVAELLSAGRDEGDGSRGVQLLEDLAAIFKARDTERLRTSVILEDLNAMEHRPWPEYRRGDKPLTAPAMARLLKPFGVRSRDFRFPIGVAKGYATEDLGEAFSRYVSPLDTQHPLHLDREETCDDSNPQQEQTCCGSGNVVTQFPGRDVADVAGRTRDRAGSVCSEPGDDPAPADPRGSPDPAPAAPPDAREPAGAPGSPGDSPDPPDEPEPDPDTLEGFPV